MPQLPQRPLHAPTHKDLYKATAKFSTVSPSDPAQQHTLDTGYHHDRTPHTGHAKEQYSQSQHQQQFPVGQAYNTGTSYNSGQANYVNPTTYTALSHQYAAQPYYPQAHTSNGMAQSQYGSASQPSQYPSYQYPGSNQYGQPAQQAYQAAAPPQIRNPFPAPSTVSQYGAQNATYDPVHAQELAQWQSAYEPVSEWDNKKGGKDGRGGNPNLAALGTRGVGTQEDALDGKAQADADKKKTVVRQGGGETWQDDTLLEWDPSKFRIYVGNLAGEVTDDSLAKAFAAYEVNKARVIRDKRTTKSKGFGFVEFVDHELGFKAAREMAGKYVGSHPITIEKAKTNVNATEQKDKKGKGKGKKGYKNHEKKGGDPLRANTGASVQKPPVKNTAGGLKVLG